MKKYLLTILLLFLGVSCTTEEEKTDSFVEPVEFADAHWGVRVEDLDTGEVLIDHFGSKQFVPASLRKLFTTFYALKTLGPDYRFYTRVYSHVPMNREGVIEGDLVLEGGSDPFFNEESLQLLARGLIERGLNTIQGGIRTDTSKYQGAPRLPDAEWEDLTWGYCPEISALTFEENQVSLFVTPAEDASYPAFVKVEQRVPYMNFLSGVGTDEKGEELELYCERGIDDNVLEVKGAIPVDSPSVEVKIAVHDPASYTRKAFEQMLLERGVKINGRNFRSNQDQYPLAEVESLPLIQIIEGINKKSMNLAAQLVYLEIPEEQRPSYPDGSGLSRHNLASPESVCRLLRDGDEKWYATFPVAGVDGTLADRFHKTIAESNLRAKTGSMSGVNTIAGVAVTKSGRNVCLCVMMNQFSQNLTEARKTLDSVVEEMLNQL